MTRIARAHDDGPRSVVPKSLCWNGADVAAPRDVGSVSPSAHEPAAATAPLWRSGSTETEGMLVSLPWSGLQYVPRHQLPATIRPSS
jgi:hypothetical protein